MTLLAFLAPETMRTLLLVGIGGGYLAYRLVRWARLLGRPRTAEEAAAGDADAASPEAVAVAEGTEAVLPSEAAAADGTEDVPPDLPLSDLPPQPASPSSQIEISPNLPRLLTAEELYVKARSMAHRPIPDFGHDGKYLKLLGESSAKGYARASAKLGDYAMRRSAWVEAYYWMSVAKKQGMRNLVLTMRDIQRFWLMAGCPRQSGNVNRIFTREKGSIGLALLDIASGRNLHQAGQFLRTCHPEFLGT